MALTDENVLGPRVKIDRAKKHIHDLEVEINAFWARNPYYIVREIDPQTKDEHHRLRIREQVPAAWGAILGDCVHNLRSSLDLLINVVIDRDCGRTGENTKFPISRSAAYSKDTMASALVGAADRTRAIIKRLKPYKGGNDALWRLHQLDILDKHKLLVPVAAQSQAIGLTFDLHKMFSEIISPEEAVLFPKLPPIFIRPADTQFPLKDGAILFIRKAEAPEVHSKHEFVFNIAFSDGQVFDREPVIPTLKQLIDFTERVVEIFRRFA